MSIDIKDCLVIGISSRALFDLDNENQIYEELGLQAYSNYTMENEHIPMKKGSGFPLIEALLKLNDEEKRFVEVIIMSRNSADTSLRIFNSIEHYGLDITRAVLSGGENLSRYLEAFNVDLFLSSDENDVKQAIKDGFCAGVIYHNDTYEFPNSNQLRIAFDGDAVIFSDEAEKIYQKDGLAAFQQHEKEYGDIELKAGPLAKFFKKIVQLQNVHKNGKHLIRTALVTARNAPAHKRVINTLRKWNLRIDEAFFLGGIEKTQILEAFGAHIFFDDQRKHTDRAKKVVPSAHVPWLEEDKENE